VPVDDPAAARDLLFTLQNFMVTWKRTLKTLSSERFLALKDGRDAAAVDLHYFPNGSVAGTVILLRDAGWQESDIPGLLKQLDEDFLPDVSVSEGTLTYTVVLGELVGNYEASE
jgi:hypothetical protein